MIYRKITYARIELSCYLTVMYFHSAAGTQVAVDLIYYTVFWQFVVIPKCQDMLVI